MEKKLTLGHDGVFCGVCSGFAEYFEVDVTFVRLITAFLILGAGSGLLAYGICWLAMPYPSEKK
jgi:phage shock protein PspC (stress-responsive transcriptional regulator)